MREVRPPGGVRLRYRVEADRIFLRIEDYVDNESRIWNMLKMMGAPLQVDSNPKALSWNRYVPKDAYPKLARSAQMLKAELLPEEGEAPGMGVEFLAMSEEDREVLGRYLSADAS